jgi:peptide/nickel transport system substrate-binding protein
MKNHSLLGPCKAIVGLLSLTGMLVAANASAQSRTETLRFVTAGSVNTLDPTMPGATRESFGIGQSIYDRLLAFDKKKSGDNWVFDLNHLRGELAESYSVSADGLVITLKLRQDAKFQDGTPVTAEDVKWSLDRAVSAKSAAAAQLLTGSLTSPEQFKIIDAHTVQITLPKPDRLALPNLATVYPVIFNSKLVKAHLSADDPWGMKWTKDNAAGSGAYVVKSFKPGEQIVLDRNDAWNRAAGGKQAGFKRIIEQSIADPATRANLLERGDADLAIDLQANDAQDIAKRGKLTVVSTPQYNSVTYVIFNTKMAPFDNVKVRQAIAAALPYNDMFKGALFGRGAPLFDGVWKNGEPPSAEYPVVQPVKTDLVQARKLLAEAGMAQGFTTTFSFSVGQSAMAEPMAALIKESLAKIGITVNIQKLPDAQMATAINDKKLVFFTEGLTAWLPSNDYWYRYSHTGDSRWNYSSLNDPELTALANKARYEIDPAKYTADAKKLNALAFKAMPMVPLWMANQDAVMARSLQGYVYEFHRQVDFRDLSRQ